MQVQNRFNYAVGERLSIRGFGPRAQFGVRGIRILVDGIPATFPDGQSAIEHVDLPSIGRVEVLRGPGSAPYGNAAGGVLTFQTRPPLLERFRQEARAVFGSHGGNSGLRQHIFDFTPKPAIFEDSRHILEAGDVPATGQTSVVGQSPVDGVCLAQVSIGGVGVGKNIGREWVEALH